MKINYLVTKYFSLVLLLAATMSHSASADSTAIFAIMAPDAYSNPEAFNTWNSLEGSKGRVHIFAHPDAQLKLSAFDGTKHFVSRYRLGRTMVEALAKTQVDRLIIFVNTHGDFAGNWCYENQARCGLNEEILIDVLEAQAKLSSSMLSEVLLVPLSCFNKPIMERFFSKAKNKDWPFAVSYLGQKSKSECTARSVAHSLLDNQIVPFEQPTEDQIEEFLGLRTLDSLVQFNNNLLGEGLSEILHYDLKRLKPAPASSLADFGFNMSLENCFYFEAAAFPSKNTVLQVVKDLVPTRFHNNIESLKFYVNERELNDNQVVIPVNGDTARPIGHDELANKKYSMLSVIISQVRFEDSI